VSKAAWRGMRMGLLSLTVLVISVAGHAAGSQAFPSTFGLGMALLLTLALSSVATLRCRSFAWILGFVLAMQLLLHFTLVVVGSGHSGAAHESLIPGISGVVGHVVASFIAAVVLKYGDGLLERWASLLGNAFGETPVLEALTIGATAIRGVRRYFSLSSVVLDFAPRRGPPVLSS